MSLLEHIPLPQDILVALLTVQNLIERRSDSFFSPYGLTAAQFNILNLLARSNGRLEQSELVEQLLVGKSSISIVLNRMFKSGFVTREEHPKDRRQTILVQTEKGKELWAKIFPVYEANVNDVFGALPETARGQFLENLAILQKTLTKRP